ncbi:MAG: hemolysin family protein [Xenococcaceae cyanobacterium MO_207.B15]|nr:hemolysin family protein [Xenococcaceae cyanobacterium MO_207.B15]MDJ0744865.1 hemolysin family protein [Xenococcaceae cyanobacterium MO_167.B27]
MTGKDFLFPLVGLLSLIAINAFFVTAEFSIVSVRRSRITQLAKDGDIQAQTVQSFQRSIDRLLSTTQLGITLSSLALGWIGEQTIAVLVATTIKQLPFPRSFTDIFAHSFAIPTAFFLLAYFQIVLGELCPKSVALIYPEQLAKFFGPPSLVIARIFRPFIWVLNQSTRCLLRLAGIEYTGQGWYNQVTSEELQLIITTEESTGLEAEERELLNKIFEFGDVMAIEIMIPRTQITYLSEQASFAELLQTIADKQYFRYPVVGESLDEVKGIIDFKTLALPLAKGDIAHDSVIEPWIEPVEFVPESTPISSLLSQMQRSHQAMVIVVDEFGGTSGIVTLQDIVAEIIGDGDNSRATNTNLIETLEDNSFIVSAQINLDELNERLQLNLPVAEGYHTLSGFLLEQWQKIPIQGEILTYDHWNFTVISAKDNRLNRIRIQSCEPKKSLGQFQGTKDHSQTELL